MAQSAKPYQCAQSQPPATMRFCPRIAAAIGVSEAIVLNRLAYWLSRSKHRIAGRAWVYNTYDAWQKQFPFWSRRTIQATFRRLERLGVVESTQRHNRSRWDKTKWYTINEAQLAELVPEPEESPADDALPTLTSTKRDVPTDETEIDTIEDEAAVPSWIAKNSSMDDTKKILKRGCTSEPDEGARSHPLGSGKAAEAVNELDLAYEQIPEAERRTWYESAEQALAAAGMPGWLRIVPTVKEMALRMWVDAAAPVILTS